MFFRGKLTSRRLSMYIVLYFRIVHTDGMVVSVQVSGQRDMVQLPTPVLILTGFGMFISHSNCGIKHSSLSSVHLLAMSFLVLFS